MLRDLVNLNVKLSRWFDSRLLPKYLSVDGNMDFIHEMAPSYLRPGTKIYDVGGGKQPFIDVGVKRALGIQVVGIDISRAELDRAPMGAYDEKICADIADVKGDADGDLVICQAVLEHVGDTERAFYSIASLLKPGGVALIFVPSRNALFARLNLLLPESIKRTILFGIFPQARPAQGFPSYYDKCTPDDFVALGGRCGLSCREARYYYMSSYFSFLFPVYFIWRLWVLAFKWIARHQAAETFSMAFVKWTESP